MTAYGFRDTSTTTVQLDRSYLPACRSVNQLPTGVSLDVADVLTAAPELSKAEAQQLLGLFERADSSAASGKGGITASNSAERLLTGIGMRVLYIRGGLPL